MMIRRVLAAIALCLPGACGPDPAPENRSAEASPAKAVAGPTRSAPANGAAPAPERPAGPFSLSGYALNGTEPFWGGTVIGTRIRYMTPENQFGSVVDTTRTLGAEEVYRGSLGGRPFVLRIRRASCSDGMSDRTWQFTAVLEVRGETRRGCADPE